MSIRLFIPWFLAPVLASAQVHSSSTGVSTSLGSGIRYSVPDYDVDAIAYFARAGVTDPTAQRQISDFVIGVKGLGLWSNIVCWPLRSSQNASSGVVAYSLGGAGTYNGTLTNGPAWGVSGITFGTDDFVSTALPVATNTGNWSCGITFQASSIIAASRFLAFNNEGKTPAYTPTTGPSVAQAYLGNSTRGVTSTFDWTSAFRTLFVTKSSTTMAGYVNGVSSGGGTIIVGGTDLLLFRVGTSSGEACNPMTASMAFFTTDVLNSSQAQSLHNLYRNTLGAGLGLP